MQWNNLFQFNPSQSSRIITNTLQPRIYKNAKLTEQKILPQQKEQQSYLSNLLVVKQIPVERSFFPIINRRKQIIIPAQQQLKIQSVLNQNLDKEEEQERKIMINYLTYQQYGFMTTSVGEIIRIEHINDGLNFKISKLTKFNRLLTCNNELYCGINYINDTSILQFFDVSEQYLNVDEYNIILPNIMIVRRHDNYIFAVNNVGGLLFQQLDQESNQYLLQTSREVSTFIRSQLKDQSFVLLSMCRLVASSFQRLPFVFVTLQTDLAYSYFRQILIYQNNIYVEFVDTQLNEISGIILHRWNPSNGRMIAQKACKISAAAALDTELIILGYNNSYVEFYFTGFRSRNNFKTPMSSMQVGSKPINCILLLECDQKGLICCITCKDDNLVHLIQIFPNKKLTTLLFQSTKMQYIRQIIPISNEYCNKLLIVTTKNKYFIINLFDCDDNQNYFVRPFKRLDNDILLLRLGTGQELTVFEQSRLINLVLFGKLYRQSALDQISDIRISKLFSEVEITQLLDNYRFYVGILQGKKLNYFGAIKMLDNYNYNPLEEQGDYLTLEQLEQFLLNNSGAYLTVTKRRAEMKQLEKQWLNHETNQYIGQMNNSSSQNKSVSSKRENRSNLISAEMDQLYKNEPRMQQRQANVKDQQRNISPTKVSSTKIQTESKNVKFQLQSQSKYIQEQPQRTNNVESLKKKLDVIVASQNNQLTDFIKEKVGQKDDLMSKQGLIITKEKATTEHGLNIPYTFNQNSTQAFNAVNQTDCDLQNQSQVTETIITRDVEIKQPKQSELMQQIVEDNFSDSNVQEASQNKEQQSVKNTQLDIDELNLLNQKDVHKERFEAQILQDQVLQNQNLQQDESDIQVDSIHQLNANQEDRGSQPAKEIPDTFIINISNERQEEQNITESGDTIVIKEKALYESPAADDMFSNQPQGLFNANQLDMSTYCVGFTFGLKPPVFVVNKRIKRSLSDDQLIQDQRYKTQDQQFNENVNGQAEYPNQEYPDQNRLYDKIVDELSKGINQKQYKAPYNIKNDVKLYERDQQNSDKTIEEQILQEQKQHFMDGIAIEIDIFEDDLQRINDDLIKMNRFIKNNSEISPDFQLESLDLRPGFLLGGPYMLSAMPMVLHHDSQLNDNIEDFGMSFILLLQPALQGMFTDSKFLMFNPQSFPNTNDYWLDIYEKEHIVPVNMIYFRRIFTEYYQSHFTKQFHEKMKILANKNISISYQQIHMYPFSLIWAYLLYYQARQIFEFTKIGINQFENPYYYQLFYPGFDLLQKYDKFAGSLFSQSISQYFYAKIQYLLYFFRGLPNTIKKYAFERGRIVIERALEKDDARKTDGELLRQYRSIQISTLQISKLQELMIFGDLQQKEIQKFSINFENRLLRPMLFFQRNHASLLFDISDIKDINYLQFFDQRQVRSMQLHADIQNQLVCSLLGKLVDQEFVTIINNQCETFSSLKIMNQPQAIIQFIPIQLVFQFAIAHESLKPKQHHYNIFVEFITYFNITGTMLVYQLEKILNRLLPTFKQEWYYKILYDVVMLELNIKASRNVFMNFNNEFIKISDQDQTIIEDYCNSTFNDSFQSQLGNLSCNDFLMQNSFEHYLPLSQNFNVVEDQLNLSHCIHQLTIILNKSEMNVQQQIKDYYNNYDIAINSQVQKTYEISFQDVIESQVQQHTKTEEQELNRDEKYMQKVKLLIQLGNLLQDYQTNYIINKDLGINRMSSTKSQAQSDHIFDSDQLVGKSNQADLLQSSHNIDSPQNINFWITQVNSQIDQQKLQNNLYLSQNRQRPDGQLLGVQRQMEKVQVNDVTVNRFLKQEFRSLSVLKSIKK